MTVLLVGCGRPFATIGEGTVNFFLEPYTPNNFIQAFNLAFSDALNKAMVICNSGPKANFCHFVIFQSLIGLPSMKQTRRTLTCTLKIKWKCSQDPYLRPMN